MILIVPLDEKSSSIDDTVWEYEFNLIEIRGPNKFKFKTDPIIDGSQFPRLKDKI